MRRKIILSSVSPLPDDFAEQVIELEAQVDLDCSLSSLRSLLQLYSQAVEYYESINDLKFTFYQEKMKVLFDKQNSLLLKKILSSNSPKNLRISRTASSLIRQHETQSYQISNQISLNISNQDCLVHTKLKERLTKIGSPRSPNLRRQLGKSRTFKFEASKFEDGFIEWDSQLYETKLEGVIEKFIEERIRREEEIRAKYKNEIGEMLKMKGGLVERIVTQMQKNMEEELYDLEKTLDTNKKCEITKIKEMTLNGEA